jgi:PAS domain S-box-containing protein
MWERRAHLATYSDAVAIGESHVKNGHVRLTGGDATNGLLGRSGLAHHFHVLFAFQQLAQPAPNDLMIIQQEHFGRSHRLHHRKSMDNASDIGRVFSPHHPLLSVRGRDLWPWPEGPWFRHHGTKLVVRGSDADDSEVRQVYNHATEAEWSWLETVADGICIVDASGVIVFASAHAATMLGYEVTELVGQSVEILVPADRRAGHEDTRSGFANRSQTRVMGTGLNIHGQRKDGSLVPLDIQLQPVGEGNLTVASIRNRSSQLDAEHQRDDLLGREQDTRVLLDLIVQRLYGISLTLRTVSPGSHEGGARLDRSSDLIDKTIELIRTTSLEVGVPSNALTWAQQDFLRRFPESIES